MALTELEFQALPKDKQAEYLVRLRGVRGKEDLLYMSTEILGFKDKFINGKLEPGVMEKVHGRLIKLIQSPKLRKMALMPRGSYKTTVGTVANTIQKIVNTPNIRILIDSEVLDNSIRFLGLIKARMRSEKFRETYGNLIGDKYRETAREFTISTRTDDTLKEPTVYATGIGTVNVSTHWDVIIIDDPHSEKNTNTKEQIDKVIAHYRLLLSLLEPHGELIIWGTRWHFYDLYDFLLEEEDVAHNPNWEYLEVDAEEKRPDGKLFFEERLSPAFLKQQRLALNDFLYSCQYRNKPTDEKTQCFKKSFFKYWGGEFEEYPVQGGKRILLNIYILIDRAFSSKTQADFTGCICAGVSSSNNIYILEAERRKCGLNELFDLVVGWMHKYGQERVKKVGVETINWEEIEVHFRQQMGKRNLYFNLVRLAPDSRQSKAGRIEAALQARYANGAIFHKKRMVDLEDELMRFPVGTHDDLIDAEAYLPQLMLAPADLKTENDLPEYEPSGFFGKTGY